MDPIEVARKDAVDVYMVDEVLDHRPKGARAFRKLGDMTVQIKWLGYNDPTWEPWANVKDTWAMVTYLTSVGQTQWIPKNIVQTEEELSAGGGSGSAEGVDDDVGRM